MEILAASSIEAIAKETERTSDFHLLHVEISSSKDLDFEAE
jgi:hypothetical protein